MRELLTAQLITHTVHPAAKDNDGDNWLPVVDGDFLPAAPSVLLDENRFANVSVIIGWTNNDFTYFTPTSIKTPEQTYNFINEYLPAFTKKHVNQLLALYPTSDFPNTYFDNGKIKQHSEFYRAARIARDILFTCQPIHIGQALAEAGNDVYFYNQNKSTLQPLLHNEGPYGMGVIHTAELIYVFGNLSRYDTKYVAYHPDAQDYYLEKHESRSWSSFVATGQPSLEGHATLPGWEKADFKDENFGTYVIGGPFMGYSGTGSSSSAQARRIMAEEKLQERCGFLNSPEIIKELQY